MKKIKDAWENRATKFLDVNGDPQIENPIQNPEKLIAELKKQQIELEIQNETLVLAKEENQRIQAKYIDLYDFAPVGYISLIRKEIISEANHTAAKLLDIGKPLLIDHSFTNFVDFDFLDVFHLHIRKVRKSKIHESCELKLRKFSGETFFARLESISVHLGHGVPIEIRISIININEKKLNLMALKESAERNEMLLNLLPQPALLIGKNRKVLAANRLAKKNGATIGELWTHNLPNTPSSLNKLAAQTGDFPDQKELISISCLGDDNPFQQGLVTVVENSNDAISLLDLKGNIKAWNRRAEELYGYSASEALEMTIFDLITPRLKNETEQLFVDICAGVIIRPFETKRIAHDGTVLDIVLKITPMFQDGNIVAVATTERDITDHNLLFASLQELPGRIIRAQEKERSRISQVLHSEFGQSLISLKFFTAVSASELSGNDSKLNKVFTKIKSELDKIINDTRNLAHELSPPGLRYVGLVPAIEDLIEAAMQNKNLRVEFIHENVDQACFKDNDIIIYRILQEALQNIFKHAKATYVLVKAIFRNSKFLLKIRDNGIGFVHSLNTTRKGLGLALMKEQAALIFGSVNIQSHEGEGTTITVSIPVKEKKMP